MRQRSLSKRISETGSSECAKDTLKAFPRNCSRNIMLAPSKSRSPKNSSEHSPFFHQRLQEQDRRNHEAYIRSGEIFEDRQQAYEKMTKNYEKLLTGCHTLVIRAFRHSQMSTQFAAYRNRFIFKCLLFPLLLTRMSPC